MSGLRAPELPDRGHSPEEALIGGSQHDPSVAAPTVDAAPPALTYLCRYVIRPFDRS